ncbi:YlaH-like protein [Planomicrobium soli]|uniref:YlaH-like protein n=1 Tax=Planomicrobium soli TaxID=1176648 RepID=A0A2P8G175_9BACL|nr:YlaH-like family protein [Planomicrobium soli]PSL27730.1 YlaH-like protein [Planomicrobium soli]
MGDQAFVYERMYPLARFLYETMPNFEIAGYALFAVIFLLSAFVYKLGFAKKLSIGQNAVIALFLLVGGLGLTFLALFLPVVEGLVIAALILILYKIRLWREKRENAASQ